MEGGRFAPSQPPSPPAGYLMSKKPSLVRVNEKILCKILNDHTMSITSKIIIIEWVHQSKKVAEFKYLEFSYSKWNIIFSAIRWSTCFLLSYVWKHSYYQGLQYDGRKPSLKWFYANFCSFMPYNQTNLSPIENWYLYWPYSIKQNIFKLSDNFETAFSDHHKLISAIMKY